MTDGQRYGYHGDSSPVNTVSDDGAWHHDREKLSETVWNMGQ